MTDLAKFAAQSVDLSMRGYREAQREFALRILKTLNAPKDDAETRMAVRRICESML